MNKPLKKIYKQLIIPIVALVILFCFIPKIYNNLESLVKNGILEWSNIYTYLITSSSIFSAIMLSIVPVLSSILAKEKYGVKVCDLREYKSFYTVSSLLRYISIIAIISVVLCSLIGSGSIILYLWALGFFTSIVFIIFQTSFDNSEITENEAISYYQDCLVINESTPVHISLNQWSRLITDKLIRPTLLQARIGLESPSFIIGILSHGFSKSIRRDPLSWEALSIDLYMQNDLSNNSTQAIKVIFRILIKLTDHYETNGQLPLLFDEIYDYLNPPTGLGIRSIDELHKQVLTIYYITMFYFCYFYTRYEMVENIKSFVKISNNDFYTTWHETSSPISFAYSEVSRMIDHLQDDLHIHMYKEMGRKTTAWFIRGIEAYDDVADRLLI